jgi:putative SOS response-associated peptidase YedK
MRWGLVPFWAKDDGIGNKLINARCETLDQKPAFRKAFERRRCLVLADGFYEWGKDGATKQPVRIVLRDHQPFAFAGLWEKWRKPDGAELNTPAIITCEATELLTVVHNRMPVILDERDYAQWLDPKLTSARMLRALLRPHSSDAMEFYPVDNWSTILSTTRQRALLPCPGDVRPRRRCLASWCEFNTVRMLTGCRMG